jgi:polar amino acid transport system substrate-binding protein
MRERKTHIVVAVLLVALVGMMAFAIGCGSSSSSSSASPTPGGSAMERATTILGHAPTGLAKTIVDRGTILVANDPNYAPQSYIDKTTKKLVGFDVDVAVEMANMLGLKPVWKHPNWDSIPPGLQAGLYDVTIGSMTSAIDGKQTAPIIVYRLKYIDFTPFYYTSTGQVFVKKGGPQIAGPADLAGKSVGVGDATTYYQWLKDNTTANVKGYKTDLDAVPDLLNGNLDFWMTAGTVGQQAILEGKPIAFSGKPLYYEDLSMGVKKGETDLLALLSYTVNQMHKDGQLSAMSKKWFNGLDVTVKQ